jgi:CheY-like chemotaxis protein/two-component sensor histidine kinase
LAGERERRRVAIELHDHLTQLLVVSRMGLTRAKQLVRDPKLAKSLADTDETLDQSLRYTRSLIAELSPRVLYELGLPPALHWLAEQMRQHGLKAEVKIDNNGLALQENQAVFMFQCVRELLWNVVKHAQTRTATVSCSVVQDQLCVVVADEGKGFDPTILQRGASMTEQFGLFSVRERLELQEGRFEIESSPGRGTRVTLKLPITTALRTEVPVVTRELESESARRFTDESRLPIANHLIRIALVDDHQMVRQGLRSVLEDYPELAVVGEAANGLEAIEVVQRLQPDVVVMDLNLPILNGIEATRRIIQERPSTIVIGLSFGTDIYVTKAMKTAGAVTCITKERAVDDLYRTIKDSVEGRLTVSVEAN